MKVLKPSDYVTMEIDAAGAAKFESFLDRNFPKWRATELLREKNAGTIRRKWSLGVDDLERNALYRKQYVEIYDEVIDLDESGEAAIEYPQNILCDIEGDRTPVAVWGK